jgi:hypothetical protein
MSRNEEEEAVSVVFLYLKFFNEILLTTFGLIIDRSS